MTHRKRNQLSSVLAKPLWIKLEAVVQLGVLNVIRVAIYRIGLKYRLSRVVRLSGNLCRGPFFDRREEDSPVVAKTTSIEAYHPQLFGWFTLPVDIREVDWHKNYIDELRSCDVDKDWWKISDFDSGVGDIKTVWEMSRMTWIVLLSKRVAQGKTSELDVINAVLDGWCDSNRPYKGLNWKCGQEASLRVISLITSALVIEGQAHANRNFDALIDMHLKRVSPTMSYAIAQDNNHGTSEAAAMFIGGCWLAARDPSRKYAMKYMKTGRKYLEERARRLIETDGTFSQYSTNYHRLMLDTYSVAEIVRARFGQQEFTGDLYKALGNATEWLRHCVCRSSGSVPFFGPNDGAHIVPLGSENYEDFRPTVQIATSLFLHQLAYRTDAKEIDHHALLKLPLPERDAPPLGSRIFKDGGFAVIRAEKATMFMRFPMFRFRPVQADALHLDLWIGEHNVLRDGGTYSYNTEERWMRYFTGTESHNTVQFDSRDQMPKVSRFLYGKKLTTLRHSAKVRPITNNGDDDCQQEFEAEYRDYLGCHHRRRATLGNRSLVVVDTISGFRRGAVLRWRVHSTGGRWNESQMIAFDDLTMKFECTAPLEHRLVSGYESRRYLQREEIPVVELQVERECTITTEIMW